MKVTIQIELDNTSSISQDALLAALGLSGTYGDGAVTITPDAAPAASTSVPAQVQAQAQAQTQVVPTGSPVPGTLDSKGIPFDPEIHSGTLTQRGTWRKGRRSADKEAGGVSIPDAGMLGAASLQVITDNTEANEGDLDPNGQLAAMEQVAALEQLALSTAAQSTKPAQGPCMEAYEVYRQTNDHSAFTAVVSNVVSNLIAQQLITTEALGQIATDLSGCERQPHEFFAMLTQTGFAPNIAKATDELLKSVGQ